MTDDIVAFIQTRLEEDEREKEHLVPPALWQRWLRGVEGKRRIVDMHEKATTDYDTHRSEAPDVIIHVHHEFCGECQCDDGMIGGEWPCDTLKLFASEWSPHPDYEPEWAL